MSITTTPRRRAGATATVSGRLSAAAARLAGRAHTAGDQAARTLGWAVTPVPGPLGLPGRAYRDPRFSARAAYPAVRSAWQGRRPA